MDDAPAIVEIKMNRASVQPTMTARFRACHDNVRRACSFDTLVVAQVEYGDAPQRLAKGLAKHPIPLMLLARLAVATNWQGKGLGAGLLKDAMVRTLQAANIAGTAPLRPRDSRNDDHVAVISPEGLHRAHAMAHRSDRRGDTPITRLAFEAVEQRLAPRARIP
jgi:hypothetical protein